MCDWKVFTVMLVVDQPMIFVESSPVPLVAHPNKFIWIGILIVYSPFNVSEFWVSYTHCLLTYSYKGYAGRVDICCSVNIKATIKASRVITVTAIAGNSY